MYVHIHTTMLYMCMHTGERSKVANTHEYIYWRVTNTQGYSCRRTSLTIYLWKCWLFSRLQIFKEVMDRGFVECQNIMYRKDILRTTIYFICKYIHILEPPTMWIWLADGFQSGQVCGHPHNTIEEPSGSSTVKD